MDLLLVPSCRLLVHSENILNFLQLLNVIVDGVPQGGISEDLANQRVEDLQLVSCRGGKGGMKGDR